MKKFPFEVNSLKNWFQSTRRDLPWRKTSDPYAIWVSEIMLQQTQVSVVKDYYLRWMAHFPTVAALASASLEEVIKMWEGLGYYSRARNLHEAARFLVENYAGDLPSSKEALAEVKGLGPYMIGAILSFAFHQKAAAVDGNAIRVLTRYYGIVDDVQKSGPRKKIWEIAEGILPEQEPWLVVEGLIELGATICKREPTCLICPLREKCSAYRQGVQRELPKKGKKVEITSLLRRVFVIAYGQELLVKKAERGKVMADLYEFPYFEEVVKDQYRPEVFSAKLGATARLSDKNSFPFSFAAQKIKTLPVVEHSFTRFRAKLYPTLWTAFDRADVLDHDWISLQEIEKYPFSSGHKKILNHLEFND
jgi:A/G-specific adenine glycosylase